MVALGPDMPNSPSGAEGPHPHSELTVSHHRHACGVVAKTHISDPRPHRRQERKC